MDGGRIGVCMVFDALDGLGVLDLFGVFGDLDDLDILDDLVAVSLYGDLGELSAAFAVCDGDADGRTFCLATRYTYEPSRSSPCGEINALIYSLSVPLPAIRSSRALIATTVFGCSDWRGLNGNCAKCTRRSFDRFAKASVFVSTVISDMVS